MKKNKKIYSRKLQYRRHYQFNISALNFDYNFLIKTIPITAIIVFISVAFDLNYSPFVKSFDFVCLGLLLPYQLLFRKMIYKGKITAYYRRTYGDITSFINGVMMVGVISYIKYSSLLAYYVYSGGDFYEFILSSFHRTVTPLSIALFLYLFYYSFYQERYTSIRDYSNSINYHIKHNGLAARSSFEAFLRIKDKEYSDTSFDGTLYDFEEPKRKQREEKSENKKENKKEYLRRQSRS